MLDNASATLQDRDGSRPVRKPSSAVKYASTPDRSGSERRNLQSKGLCYHCISQEPGPHRANRCPAKKAGVVAKPMPADFSAKDWPEKA